MQDPIAPDAPHIPVLLAEVLEAMNPQAEQVIIDGTFGAGGYTRAILERGANVIAFDQDPIAITAGQAMVAEFAGRLQLIHAPFGQMAGYIQQPVHGVVLDIGVSSMQLDEAHRGFSFRADAPLDMRMRNEGPTAADLCNTLTEYDLASVLFRYGEEAAGRRIAKAIIAARPLATTKQLVKIVEGVIKPHAGMKISPSTRTFQALRIAVNDELRALIEGLEAAHNVLADGGILAVVSFHSLEDRIVKQFLKGETGDNVTRSRHMPDVHANNLPLFDVPSRKGITPSDIEIARNPRSRSARLRVGIKQPREKIYAEQQLKKMSQYLLKSFVLNL